VEIPGRPPASCRFQDHHPGISMLKQTSNHFANRSLRASRRHNLLNRASYSVIAAAAFGITGVISLPADVHAEDKVISLPTVSLEAAAPRNTQKNKVPVNRLPEEISGERLTLEIPVKFSMR
jgi:hypothetical protein